jgi:hypothetical protein
MSLIKGKFILAALLLSANASAELLHTDWQSAGDGQVTFDSDTGIEWLKLLHTSGWSINNVSAQTGVGGAFEGWRLPTQAEVRAHMTVLTGREFGTTQLYSEDLGTRQHLQEFLGLSGTSDRYAYGLHVMDDNRVLMSGLYVPAYSYSQYYHSAYSHSYTSSAYAVFLVSDGGASYSSLQDPSMNVNNPRSASYGMSDVSTPVALGGLALLALGGWRRRQG